MKLYKSVCIAITNKCTASCKMCCYDCSPKKDSHLSYETISDLIDQIKAIGGVENLNITGGEPFLYYEDLKKVVEKATKENISVTCLTNSYWCNDYDKTVQRLQELKSLGLKEIYTSMDVFHREYILPEQVGMLLRASKDVGLASGLNIVSVRSRNQELFHIIEELGDALFNVKISVFPLNVVGEQKKLLHNTDVAGEKTIDHLKCRFNRVLLINYDGDVYPCCSNYIQEIPSLKIGNIYESKIGDIINRASRQFPFGKILRYGLLHLAEVVRENNLMTIEPSYIDGCQLCKTIFSNQEVCKQLEQILK